MFEITSDYLEEMTHAVRVKQTHISDAELTDLIQAALYDISRQGAEVVKPEDPLVKMAVRLYCKAHYGYDSPDQQARFLTAYEELSKGIALQKAGDQT